MMDIDLNTLPFFEDNSLSDGNSGENPVVVSSDGGKREKVLVLKPSSINEVQPLIDFLKQRKMAVVDLSDAGDDSQRILDFAAGAVYALTGIRPVPAYPETRLRPLRVGFYAEFTRVCVRQLFELERRPELDVMQVDGHDLLTGILRHLDVLVIAGDRKALLEKGMADPVRAGQFRDFLARGGRIVTSADSAKVLPEHANVTVVAETDDIVRAVIH